MAVVHAVRSAGGPNAGEHFAMKRILPELASSRSFVRMFCEEASLGRRLRHPNVVRVVDFGEQDGELVLVTEYVDGTSCARLLSAAAKGGESIPLAAALFVACEVLEALSYIHGARDDHWEPLEIVHRDLSPGNILLGAMGEVKLTDFGVAHFNGREGDTNPGMLKGKLGYMSPEQIDGASVDGRSDLFSLGVVLFEMLTGKPCFDAADDFDLVAKMHDAPLSPLGEPHALALPLELRLILATALCRSRDDRFSDAAEFGDALRGFAHRSGTPLERRSLLQCLRRFDIWPLRSGTYPAVSTTELKFDLRCAARQQRG